MNTVTVRYGLGMLIYILFMLFFSFYENNYGYDVASTRIHIERVIQRMKIFNILHYFPHTLMKSCDAIINIIAFICNLFPDIIKRD